MEEMMMVMMKIRRQETAPNIPVTTPTWKLYENPFYISHNLLDQQQDDHNQIHRLNLPISTRKIAASFWDLTFIKPFMESELEAARAQISVLKAELEHERKSRKKMECLNKRVSREERKRREALERVCEQLTKEISAHKNEITRMRSEMDEERKMLRTAQVIREERVQMKLAEAKIVLEERLSQLEISNNFNHHNTTTTTTTTTTTFGQKIRFVLGEKALLQKKGCAENPHIKRGIKGFVEFPKVVRAIGCTTSKHLGSKLECQKAQLKILLKHKGPAVRLNGLIAS